MKGFFVTGTGTDVGKTYVAAQLCKVLKDFGTVAYYKPAMSGNCRDESGYLVPGDARFVRTVAGLNQREDTMCPYVYEPAYSPHLAARLEGRLVKLQTLMDGFAALTSYDYLVVEGAGGVLCPFRDGEHPITSLDLIRAFGLPLVVVADAGLGTLNSLGLTAFWCNRHALPVAGYVLNRYGAGDPIVEDNAAQLPELTGWRQLGRVPSGGELQLTVPLSAWELSVRPSPERQGRVQDQ